MPELECIECGATSDHGAGWRSYLAVLERDDVEVARHQRARVPRLSTWMKPR